MPRPLRADFAGARHHVMNRGARHAPVFLTDEICADFLAIVGDLPTRFGIEVHGYALMPNHFHLMLETPRANLSRAMQFLSGEFVRRVNLRQTWDGPIFKGRFRSRVVETEAYWRDLLCYLHLNPVRARLVTKLDDTRWTSHAAYAGASTAPEWLTTTDLLDLFGGREGYAEEIGSFLNGRRRVADAVDPASLWKRATAGVPVVAAPPRVVDTASELARVAHLCGVPLEVVTVGRRGRGDHRPRWVAAWWLVTGLGLSNRGAAEILGAQETMVCRWIGRVTGASVAPEVTRWMAAIRAGGEG